VQGCAGVLHCNYVNQFFNYSKYNKKPMHTYAQLNDKANINRGKNEPNAKTYEAIERENISSLPGSKPETGTVP
jgi:hypothetical protein